MNANKFFWATALLGIIILTGSLAFAVRSFSPAYLTFIKYCGLSLATGQAILDAFSPAGTLGIAITSYVVALLIWQVVQTRVLVSHLAGAKPPQSRYLKTLMRRLGLSGRLRVVEGSVLFCTGIFRPEIILGTEVIHLLSQRELEAALRHEEWHLRSRDPLKVLITNSLSRALFFLPPIGSFARAYFLEKELAADRFAEVWVGRPYLTRALAKVLFNLNRDHASFPGYVSAFAELRSLPQNPRLAWTELVFLAVVVGLVLVASSHNPTLSCL